MIEVSKTKTTKLRTENMQFCVIVKNRKRESQQKAAGLHKEKVILRHLVLSMIGVNQERVVEGSASFRSALICDITKWVPVTCLPSLK